MGTSRPERECWELAWDAPVPKDLRPGWEAQWDSNYNCFYMFNRQTQQRQWLMREAHRSTAETVHQEAKAEGTTRVSKDAGDKAMCKKGCGRAAAMGFTSGGNPFDTCCR